MLNPDSIVLRVGKTPVQLVGKGYGTVFSAGAADADNELMLALGNIIRNQKTCLLYTSDAADEL